MYPCMYLLPGFTSSSSYCSPIILNFHFHKRVFSPFTKATWLFVHLAGPTLHLHLGPFSSFVVCLYMPKLYSHVFPSLPSLVAIQEWKEGLRLSFQKPYPHPHPLSNNHRHHSRHSLIISGFHKITYME